MNKQNVENYHKFHKTTMSYGEAEKYIKVGWVLESVIPVHLKGIEKDYEECRLIWTKDENPVLPD